MKEKKGGSQWSEYKAFDKINEWILYTKNFLSSVEKCVNILLYHETLWNDKQL